MREDKTIWHRVVANIPWSEYRHRIFRRSSWTRLLAVLKWPAVIVVLLFCVLVIAAWVTPPPDHFELAADLHGISTSYPARWQRFSDWVHRRKYVVLSFDDGPAGKGMDERFLAILRKHHAHAIFFLVCSHINEMTGHVLGEIERDGNIIGNHSFDHPHVETLTYPEVLHQVGDCNERIAEMTGHDPHFYRPPFGRTSATVAEVAKQVGVRQVFWSASSFDYWYGEPEKIVQMSVDGTGDLTILLMHERKGTLAALDEVLTKLEERGFSFVLPDR